MHAAEMAAAATPLHGIAVFTPAGCKSLTGNPHKLGPGHSLGRCTRVPDQSHYRIHRFTVGGACWV